MGPSAKVQGSFSDIPGTGVRVGWSAAALPEGESGVEFTTAVPPDPFLPPGHARWTGPRDGVSASVLRIYRSAEISSNQTSRPK